jgi:hypothetical protein
MTKRGPPSSSTPHSTTSSSTSSTSATVKVCWSAKEDNALRALVDVHGAWRLVASGLVGRTGKQCRARWYNHLDPSINRGPWLVQEDELIRNLVALDGTCWADISRTLTSRGYNRTDMAIKNRYNTFISRQVVHTQKMEIAEASASEGAGAGGGGAGTTADHYSTCSDEDKSEKKKSGEEEDDAVGMLHSLQRFPLSSLPDTRVWAAALPPPPPPPPSARSLFLRGEWFIVTPQGLVPSKVFYQTAGAAGAPQTG